VLVIARRFVGASIVPLLALLVSLGTRILVPLLLAALFVGVPLAVLAWWRFTYRIAGARLEVRSGVVSRTTRVVPLDRIRGVDVTAPFLHRLLGLVKVEIEAAAGGGNKAELSLPAVSRAEADLLRDSLLARVVGETAEQAPPTLYRATPRLLVLGGLTSGRYLLAPAAVVGIVLNLADDLPGNLFERVADETADRAPTDPAGIAAVAVGVILLVLGFAAAGSLLVDWDFTLHDEGERLTATRGLLTRRTVSIDRERVRGLDVRDTPLRRPLQLVGVTAIAGGVRGSGGRTTLAPVIGTVEAVSLLRSVDAQAPDPAARLHMHPRSALPRRLWRALPLPLVAAVVSALLGWWWVAAVSLGLTAAAVPLALDRYRQLGHRFDGRRVVLRGGSLLRRWSELDPKGIVAFELRRSPGQRRAGLGTLVVHLGEGAGSRRALDLGTDQARELLPRLHPRLFEPLLPATSGDRPLGGQRGQTPSGSVPSASGGEAEARPGRSGSPA
jgi:putative membrane protein